MDHQDNTVQHTVPDGNGKQLPGDKLDVDRWARLIADGQVSFPAELSLLTQEVLAREVSQFRRQRLLRFIARAIAMDIYRSSEP
jgi:hypothetical protein